ncbi:MAG: hypothetical protein ACRDIA_06285, partial [Actinomycetota bacterium]
DLEGILEADQWARRIAGELTGLSPSPDPAGPGEDAQRARRIAGELTGLPPSPDPAGPGEADQ